MKDKCKHEWETICWPIISVEIDTYGQVINQTGVRMCQCKKCMKVEAPPTEIKIDNQPKDEG